MIKIYKLKYMPLISFLLIFALVSCSKTGTSSSTSIEELPSWLSFLEKTSICTPPCWEDIIPGESSFTNANATIRNRSDVENIYQDSGPLSKSQKKLSWHFTESGETGEIYSDLDGIKVATIIIHTKNPIPLEKIVSHFGPPDELSMSQCLPEGKLTCTTSLLYPEIGLAIRFYSFPITKENNPNYKINILPDLKIYEMILFSSGIDGYVQATKNKVADNLDRTWKWEGFGDYSYP
jgi:hypothetical protein